MNNELLIIGMSPGNSYFRQEVIDQLLPYALSTYRNISIFIPDVPATSTYVALGYAENIARREKAIPQGNAFRNRIRKTIEGHNLESERITVFDWRNDLIEERSEYRTQYEYIENLYRSNKDFERDINEATSAVLVENPLKKKEIDQDDIRKGTHYILSEFAFMMFLPFWKKEHSKFIYSYHKSWPVWKRFIAGDYDGTARENLDFVKLPTF